jgi:tetratricopeptide (TPR) repeat protein
VSDVARSGAGPARQRARALKDRCYAAWHSDPADAARAAGELEALCVAEANTPDAVEIAALADWTAAIAAIGAGEFTRALERLDRAHTGFIACALLHDAAATQVPKVMTLALLGRFEAAEACATVARDTLVDLGDLGAAARVVLNLGSLCYSRDRYADAARHYRLASAWFARAGDREHSILADIARGDAQSFLGDLDEAESLYRRAALRASAHALHVITATATQALAELALTRGNYRSALDGLQAARREFAALGLPLLVRQVERALADTYLELNLLDEADALYQPLTEVREEEATTTAWVWVQRARIASARGAAGAAAAAFDRATVCFEHMDNDVGRAEVALGRATLAMNAGEWLAARALAADAHARLVALDLPAAHALLAVAAADVRLAASDAALGALRTLLDDPATPLPVRERGWLWHGRALLASGAREAARRSFEHAVELAEAGFARLPADDVQRGYFDARTGAYEELLRLELAASAVRRDDALAVGVLAAVERLRARTLAVELALPGCAEPGSDTATTRAARERLDWIYRRSSRQLRDEADEPLPAGIDNERQALERQLLEQFRGARLADHDPGAARPPIGIDWDAVRESQADDEALVVYGRIDDEIFAISLHERHVRLHRGLATPQAVAAAQAALGLQLDTRRLGAAHLERHGALLLDRTRRALGRLHDLLWLPVAHALGAAAHARIVPCAEFGALPFAALWDGRRYLAEGVATTRLISLAAALDRPPPPVPQCVLLLADTERLAGTRVELDGLAAIWPERSVLGGQDATRDAFRRGAPGADLLHVACHGQFRADSPRFSALHLRDGAFTALELESLRLPRHPIVVLAGCDTGRADTSRGDESLGIVRAFLVAGASRVIAAHWAVDDARTAEWMLELHRELRDAGQQAEPGRRWVTAAVAAIQRRYIARGAHPYDWAGFTLHGGS